MRHRHAFTLIELLVVVAIIALLISILLPSLARSKALAKQTVCGTQIHQTQVAMFAYASGNRNKYPPPVTPGTSFDHWPIGGLVLDNLKSPAAFAVLVATDYIDTPEIFYCPSSQNGRTVETHWYPKQETDPGNWYGTGVDYAYWVGHTTQQVNTVNDKLPQFIVKDAQSPSNLVMFSDMTCQVTTTFSWASWSNHWGSNGDEPDGGNVGTHDGSVGWRNFDRMDRRLIRAALQFYF